MRWYWLSLGILGVWRVTHLLAAEDGPWDLIAHVRRAAGNGFWGKLLDCFYCLSLWVAAPFALSIGRDWRERVLLWPALSGAAILLERAVPARERAVYQEDQDPPESSE
jgi:Protein of unknown function (DUF1360)